VAVYPAATQADTVSMLSVRKKNHILLKTYFINIYWNNVRRLSALALLLLESK